MTTTNESEKPDESAADFSGASVIDNEGNEIPITDKMIKKACDSLETNRKKD